MRRPSGDVPVPARDVVISAADVSVEMVNSWPLFRKRVLTRAVRMDGPFVVETSEGPLRCEDGWLAVDARGYPYPIAADEFELIYEVAA